MDLDIKHHQEHLFSSLLMNNNKFKNQSNTVVLIQKNIY